MREQFFQNSDALVSELVDHIARTLKESIDLHGRASLAVSGGSTPQPLFRELAKQDLSWDKVTITLVDERWVAPTDPASNEHLVRQYLLQGRAAAATFIGLKNDALTAQAGEVQCEEELGKIPRPFSVLILGMGNDGHTASLFPGSPQLAAATDMNSAKICMSTFPTDAPHERMTLTLPAILDTDKIFLHIRGSEKKSVLEKAQGAGSSADMPVRCILRQQDRPVTVYWAP